MSVLLGALWLGAICASGHAMVAAWCGAGDWRGAARLWRIGAAALFGAGISSAGFGMVLLTAGPRLDALAAKDLLLVAGSLMVIGKSRMRMLPPVVPAQRGHLAWWSLLALATAVVTFAWVMYARVVADADWDAWMIWNMRARFFVRAPADLARAFAPSLAFSHTDYPLLVPGLVAPAWMILGSEPAWTPALVSNALTFACLLVLVGSLAVLRSGTAAAVGGLTLLGAPFYVGQGAAQCADVPVSAFVCLSASLVAWAVAREDGRRALTWVLAGTTASFAAWTKNEGLLFFVTGAAAVCLVPAPSSAHVSLRRSPPATARLRRTAWFVAGGLPVLLLVTWFKSSFGIENDLFALSTAEGAVARVLDVERYMRIAQAMALEPFLAGKWNALPAVLAAGVVALRGQRSAAGAGPLGAWLGLLLAGFFAVYVLTPHDLGWHLVTSLDRLIVQVWPLGVLAAFLATGDGPRCSTASGSDDPDVVTQGGAVPMNLPARSSTAHRS